MTNFREQLNNATKDIRLSAEEKRTMREALSYAMGAPSPVKVVQSPYVFLSHTWMRALAAFVLVVFTGGSTAFAAQGALPGEPLYAIKTKVIEPAQLALASDTAAKAAVHASLAERRIEEAEALAQMGTLDATSSEMLAADFDVHSDAAVALADEASKTDPSAGVEIKTRVRASSSAGGAVLAALARKSNDESVREHSDNLAVRVLARAEAGNSGASRAAFTVAAPAPQTKVMALSAADASATATAATEPQAEVEISPAQERTAAYLQEKANQALTQARTRLQSAPGLSASTTADIEANLASIDALMAIGAASLGAGEFNDAVRNFTEAYSRAIKLQVLLKAHKSFNDRIVEPLLKWGDDYGDNDGGDGDSRTED